MTLPSRAVRRRRSAAGWAARHANLSPEERQAKINEQCALARQSRWKGHIKKDRPLPRAWDPPVDIPSDAFVAKASDGEWETVGEEGQE